MSFKETQKKRRDREFATILRTEAFQTTHKLTPDQAESFIALQTNMVGSIIFPSDPSYNQDRKIDQLKFDFYPIYIAYCEVDSDVVFMLTYVKTWNIDFRVRAGGHSTAGYCSLNNGALIDVSGIDDIAVDPVKQTATIGAGARFEKIYATLDTYGLHLPGGECGDVAIAGYVQGGGYSFTSLVHGMNCDSVLSMRVLLVDGTIVVANSQNNPDLFWAMRGGTGGNFGILLQVTYRVYQLGKVYGFSMFWPISTSSEQLVAGNALSFLIDRYMPIAPAGFCPQVMVCFQATKPDLSDSKPYVLIRGMFLGNQAAGRAAIKPLLALPGVTFQYDLYDKFSKINDYLFDNPHPIPQWPAGKGKANEDKQARYIDKPMAGTDWLNSLSAFVTNTPNTYSYMCLEIYGGAINKVPVSATSFVHRTAKFSAFLDVWWYDPADQAASETFLTNWCNGWGPFWNGEIYQNYPSPNVPDFPQNYWGPAYPILQVIKKKYDPNQVLTYQQSITPLKVSAKKGVKALPATPGYKLPQKIRKAIFEPINRSLLPPSRQKRA